MDNVLVRAHRMGDNFPEKCPTCGEDLKNQDTHHVPGSRSRLSINSRFPKNVAVAVGYEEGMDHSLAQAWLYCSAGHGYMHYLLPSGFSLRLMRRVRSQLTMIPVDDVLAELLLIPRQLDQVKRVLQAQVQRGEVSNEPDALLASARKMLGRA